MSYITYAFLLFLFIQAFYLHIRIKNFFGLVRCQHIDGSRYYSDLKGSIIGVMILMGIAITEFSPQLWVVGGVVLWSQWGKWHEWLPMRSMIGFDFICLTLSLYLRLQLQGQTSEALGVLGCAVSLSMLFGENKVDRVWFLANSFCFFLSFLTKYQIIDFLMLLSVNTLVYGCFAFVQKQIECEQVFTFDLERFHQTLYQKVFQFSFSILCILALRMIIVSWEKWSVNSLSSVMVLTVFMIFNRRFLPFKLFQKTSLIKKTVNA